MSDCESLGTLGGSDLGAEYNDNGLKIDGSPFRLEKIDDYESGGHHPVHFGDVLHERYRVIHKLGSGGYANVWLCKDISPSFACQFVAAKIITAEDSTKDCPELRITKLEGLVPPASAELFCLPLDRFDIKGPNGIHYVFVYPVLGPRVSRLLHLVNDSGDPSGPLRTFCRQTTQAMAVLHSLGICHGDFRPANILARISGLDGMSENEVMEILGKPRTSEVVTVSGDAHHLDTAPKYVVYPIDWDKVISNPKGASLVDEKASVIDFGESFEVSAPTPDLGIPQVYCSPEYTLEGTVGIESDIWALGCTLFEIRTGRKLFAMFDDDKDEYLCKVAMVLGKLPEPWWSDTWEARRQYLQDETDASGRVVEVSRDNSAMAADQAEGERHVVVYERPEPRSVQEAIREGLYYENWDWPGGIERDISEKEIGVFADLLAKLLRYSPGDRLSAAEALEHDWFRHGGFGDD